MIRYKPLKETIEQTKTPEFKKWFGKSKVVDKSGNPLVVYHGGGKNFTNFKSATERPFGIEGIYFAENPNLSSMYAMQHQKKQQSYPVYLKITNPGDIKEMRDWGYDNNASPKEVTKYFQKLGYDGAYDKEAHYKGGSDKVWIVFKPNQIKSAIGNNGNFDYRSNNILEGIE